MKVTELLNEKHKDENEVYLSTRNPDNDHIIEIEAEVTNYRYEPGKDSPHKADSDVDYYGEEDIDFEINSVYDQDDEKEIDFDKLSSKAQKKILDEIEQTIQKEAKENRKQS